VSAMSIKEPGRLLIISFVSGSTDQTSDFLLVICERKLRKRTQISTKMLVNKTEPVHALAKSSLTCLAASTFAGELRSGTS